MSHMREAPDQAEAGRQVARLRSMRAVGELTSGDLRHAYGAFPTGVISICGLVDGSPVGMACSSFTSVSLEPALVSVCMDKSSSTWPVLQTASGLGISILTSEQTDVANDMSAKGVDRFGRAAWWSTPSGAVLIDHAAVWFECSIAEQVDAGDHRIALLRVEALSPRADTAPMVFHASRYRSLASV